VTISLFLIDKICSFRQGGKERNGEGTKQWDEGGLSEVTCAVLRADPASTVFSNMVTLHRGQIDRFRPDLKTTLRVFFHGGRSITINSVFYFFCRNKQPSRFMIKITGLIHTVFD